MTSKHSAAKPPRLKFAVYDSRGMSSRRSYYVGIKEEGKSTFVHMIYAPSYRAACDMSRALREGYAKRGKL